ncbi:MAG TPA: hypothetical protein VM186_12755 [Planctomycetota bacterium]|nr:hypothetical protein [Planctomycetota bacterium]
MMAHKLSILFAFGAFLVAWLSGLRAGVPPDSILVRSLVGVALFYALGLLLCKVAVACLDLPQSEPRDDEQAEGGAPAAGPEAGADARRPSP